MPTHCKFEGCTWKTSKEFPENLQALRKHRKQQHPGYKPAKRSKSQPSLRAEPSGGSANGSGHRFCPHCGGRL